MNSIDNQPLVSVLMTAYNREKYIVEAIESVLASTYSNVELIIVDDGSKDATVEIAKSYLVKDSRIKFYINEKNLGDYPNRNRAASYATGEYIMSVDSDDTIYPDTIKKVVEVMSSYPNANIGMVWKYTPETFVIKSEEAIRYHFYKQQFLYIGPGGTIIRRSFFNEIKGYPEKYGPANDMYFNLKVACYSDIALIPFEFVFYRRHDGQEINNRYSYLYNTYLYQKDAFAELPMQVTPKELRWLIKKMKRRFFVNLVNYYFKTKDIAKIKDTLRITKFGFSDAMQAIF